MQHIKGSWQQYQETEEILGAEWTRSTSQASVLSFELSPNPNQIYLLPHYLSDIFYNKSNLLLFWMPLESLFITALKMSGWTPIMHRSYVTGSCMSPLPSVWHLLRELLSVRGRNCFVTKPLIINIFPVAVRSLCHICLLSLSLNWECELGKDFLCLA